MWMDVERGEAVLTAHNRLLLHAWTTDCKVKALALWASVSCFESWQSVSMTMLRLK